MPYSLVGVPKHINERIKGNGSEWNIQDFVLTLYPLQERINMIGGNDNTFLGSITKKSVKKTESTSYINMKEKQIAKRRARNKVARKSRRLNRLRVSSKHCKFYAKG